MKDKTLVNACVSKVVSHYSLFQPVVEAVPNVIPQEVVDLIKEEKENQKPKGYFCNGRWFVIEKEEDLKASCAHTDWKNYTD